MANLKKGFLPIKTNWFDRLFIGVISYIALQLLWMRFIENFISINVSIGLGLVLIFLIMWKG
jgi:predicted small integral membrane protein